MSKQTKKKKERNTRDGGYKGRRHAIQRKGPDDGAKEKTGAKSIVECFSSGWKGDI